MQQVRGNKERDGSELPGRREKGSPERRFMDVWKENMQRVKNKRKKEKISPTGWLASVLNIWRIRLGWSQAV